MDAFGPSEVFPSKLKETQGQVVVHTEQHNRETSNEERQPAIASRSSSKRSNGLKDREQQSESTTVFDQTQMKLLNKMFDTHRAIYNKLVECSREDCRKLTTAELTAKYRPISQKHSLANYLPDHHLDIPEGVMDSTFRDYTKALKSSMALFKALKKKDKKTSFLEMKFKSKKHNSSSIEIRARDTKSSGVGFVRFFSKYFGFSKNEGIKIKQELPEREFAVRLQRTGDEKFYLCVPRLREFEQTSSSRVCAIDPGVRSFITMYGPEGLTLGVDDADEEIFRSCLTIDRALKEDEGDQEATAIPLEQESVPDVPAREGYDRRHASEGVELAFEELRGSSSSFVQDLRHDIEAKNNIEQEFTSNADVVALQVQEDVGVQDEAIRREDGRVRRALHYKAVFMLRENQPQDHAREGLPLLELRPKDGPRRERRSQHLSQERTQAHLGSSSSGARRCLLDGVGCAKFT